MDHLSKDARSQNMAQIKSLNTKPELVVRSMLHKMGFRFRLHRKDLPGNPDIVLPKYKIAVFVHGCFWHCHEGCSNFRIPKTRTEWWAAKLSRNKARDADVSVQLKAMGWDVVVIWECEVNDARQLAQLIEKFKNAM